MNFEEAVRKYRQRDLLPEEQVIAETMRELWQFTIRENQLERALLRALAIDAGSSTKGLPDHTWQQEIAMLECVQALAQQIVEHRVILADLKA